ncbi:hypothetical protein DPX16_19651 [Anabarilius grahami]|uniref:Uncharacterized protein n=1 Tax=Anabarilius grahami TaxID=495550 RepID=A0A3N0XL03_ANAGA|nr:hypothetical protein DPX16_19651 [Anabarilius grahami]
MELHSCRPVRVPMLTPVHRRKRQQWTRPATSTSTSISTICCPPLFICQVSTMASFSLDSAVGLHPGCALGGQLAPSALVSSLALPTIIAALVSSAIISSCFLPFARPLSSSRAPTLSPHFLGLLV